MFIINEYAAGVLVIVTGATLLFMACVMALVLFEGVSIVAHTLCNHKHAVIQPSGKWMTSESPALQRLSVSFSSQSKEIN